MERVATFISWLTRRGRNAAALIALVTLIAYFPIFQNAFITSYDDGDFFMQWEEVKDLRNIPLLIAGNLPLKHNHVYRPIRSVMQAVLHQISSTHTFVYHLFAVAVLVASAYLVYCITKKLRDAHTGLIAALFFAVLPVHVESITFTTASFDTAGIVFALLSFYCYLLFREKNKRIFLHGSVAMALIGYFTYDFALTLPLLVVAYEIIFHHQSIRAWPRLGRLVAPYLGGAVFYLFIKYAIVGQRYFGAFFQHYPLHERLMTSAKTFFQYIVLTVVNYPLTIHHKVWIERSVSDPHVLLALGGIIAYLGGAWYAHKKRHALVAFMMIWFMVSLLPVANFIEIANYLSEHYLYLASVGWVVLIACGCTAGLSSPRLNAAARVGVLTLALGGFLTYATVTWARNKEWKDDETLWRSTLARDPHDVDAYVNLAFYFAQVKNDFIQSDQLLTQALAIDPDNALAHGNRGLMLLQQEQYEKAIAMLTKALETEKNNAAFFLNRGLAYHNLNRTEEALKDYQEAVRLYPNFYEANFNAAVLYIETGRNDEAITHFSRAVALRPHDHESNYGLGRAYAEKRDFGKAREYLDRALVISPSFAPARELLDRL